MSADNKFMNGKIYALRSDYTDEVYIGSTIQNLNDRLRGHKKDFKKYLIKKRSYMTSFQLIMFLDCRIELIEAYPCENKSVLFEREQYHIKNIPNCINKYKAGSFLSAGSKKEYDKIYRAENAEKIIKYRKENAEKIKKYMNQKHTCELCGGRYTTQNKLQHLNTKKHLSKL